jgi:hypothetical protein
MKTYEGVKVYVDPLFLTSTLDGGEWLPSRPGPLTPWLKDPGTNYIGVWVGPRTGLDSVEKGKISYLRPKIEPRPSSPSLYRLMNLT